VDRVAVMVDQTSYTTSHIMYVWHVASNLMHFTYIVAKTASYDAMYHISVERLVVQLSSISDCDVPSPDSKPSCT
jgi:hypothetical protein